MTNRRPSRNTSPAAPLLALAACLLLAAAAPASASFILGAGYGVAKAPTNDDPAISGLAPNGDSEGTFYAEWIGTDGPDPRIPRDTPPPRAWWAFGASFFLYEVNRAYTDTADVALDWQVIHINASIERTFLLGSKLSAPRVSLRAGLSVIPVQVTATRTFSDFFESDTQTETRFGPYLGASLRVPVPDTQFGAFGVVSKSFANSTHLREDVGVGALFAGLGVSYTIR